MRDNGVDADLGCMTRFVHGTRLDEHLRSCRVRLVDERRGVPPEQDQYRYTSSNRGFDSFAVVFPTLLVGLGGIVEVGDDDVLAKGSIGQPPDVRDASTNLIRRASTEDAATASSGHRCHQLRGRALDKADGEDRVIDSELVAKRGSDARHLLSHIVGRGGLEPQLDVDKRCSRCHVVPATRLKSTGIW